MIQYEIAEKEVKVLKYLKNEQKFVSENNVIVSYYGVSAKDIIKFIEHPELCGRWPFDYVFQIENTITKISKKYIIDFPQIEIQTEEDRVLSKLLKKNNFLAFGTNTFFDKIVTVKHVIQFMERDPIIYEWNAYFVWLVSHVVLRVKEKLI